MTEIDFKKVSLWPYVFGFANSKLSLQLLDEIETALVVQYLHYTCKHI